LDLFLYDGAGNLIGSSTGTGNNEQITLAGRGAGTYYVQVKGVSAATTTNPHYALSIAAPQATIAPDAFEPNDTAAQAADLGTIDGQRVVTNLSVHAAGNDDWFRFTTVSAGGAGHQVRVDFTGA